MTPVPRGTIVALAAVAGTAAGNCRLDGVPGPVRCRTFAEICAVEVGGGQGIESITLSYADESVQSARKIVRIAKICM
jgi:hypothetical protein